MAAGEEKKLPLFGYSFGRALDAAAPVAIGAITAAGVISVGGLDAWGAHELGAAGTGSRSG